MWKKNEEKPFGTCIQDIQFRVLHLPPLFSTYLPSKKEPAGFFSIVCEDIYQTRYCQMLAKADDAAGGTTKCCGKLDGNFLNIQGTQEDKRAILKKECYKTCEYCGKDIYFGNNCLKLKVFIFTYIDIGLHSYSFFQYVSN